MTAFLNQISMLLFGKYLLKVFIKNIILGLQITQEGNHVWRVNMFSVFQNIQEWKTIFQEKTTQTFADWLRYYNDLDEAPGLEALEKMRAFYAD